MCWLINGSLSNPSYTPTNTPRGFHIETTWNRLNVESTWCVCRDCTKMKFLIIDFFSICDQMRRTKFILAKFSNQKNAESLSSIFVPLSEKSLSIYCMTHLKCDTCISMRLPFTKMMFHSLCRTCALGYG